MDNSLIQTCSPEVRKGLKFLENRIDENDDKFTIPSVLYVINKVKPSKIQKLRDKLVSDGYWEKNLEMFYEFPLEAWFLLNVGIRNEQYIGFLYEFMKGFQNVEGRMLFSTRFEHSDSFRLLTAIAPESEITRNAANYLVKNWQSLSDNYFDTGTLSVGILALSDIGFYEYNETIRKMGELLKSYQRKEGFFGKIVEEKSHIFGFGNTSMSVIALSRIFDADDSSLIAGAEWIKKKQLGNGSWKGWPHETSYALLALFSIGEGPKQSLDILEWAETLQIQKIKYMRPLFLCTSPILESKSHVKEIHDRIKIMINSAQNSIRIASLYIDILHEELIEFCKENPHVEVKIICRPARDIRGLRERIAKNVLDLLNAATRGNVRKNELLHSRLIIVDDKQLLVSSADLTRDQLFDEFNAGIYTKDEESIKRAISFFENMWINSEQIKN